MATTLSPSSPGNDDNIPTATLALPSIPAASVSRRLPPPCWSPEETTALIDAYRDKWYSLHRGNLRANHWQEVADDVGSRCPVTPTKTAVQCRHKMEKLRKRYRSECQRSAGPRRFTSAWPHFQSMHSMEKGPNPTPPSSDDDDDGEGMDDVLKNGVKRVNNFYGYNQKGVYGNQAPLDNGVATGVRIKIPGRVAPGPSTAQVYSNYDEMGGGQNPDDPYSRFAANAVPSGYGAGPIKVMRDRFAGRSETAHRTGKMPKKKNGDGINEVVASIQALGEGFMRIEKVKMDMARQVEEMRMEMELKRTDMILESQQRIVETFAKAISESSSKRAKKMAALT